ncbi:MAG: 2-iminoacetate synthase ThiH [candidate division FCPU426 bacterium]
MHPCFSPEQQPSPQTLAGQLAGLTAAEVERSLSKPRLEAEDLLALLSSAAEPFLETMARQAQALTRRRFGRVMKLYAPLYVSNECTNACVYCGFNRSHDIRRRTLSLGEVEAQAGFLADQGFQNLLLVSGESRKSVPVEYLRQCLLRLGPRFPELSLEVYPLEAEEYRSLAEAGLYGLALYQETYQPEVYAAVHPSGEKRDFRKRLLAPQLAAAAGLRQVSLGALLGLADFRLDAYYLGLHARSLQKQYWRTNVALSFPRLRPATGGYAPPQPVSDRQFVQLVAALRLFLPDAPFSLSTREPESLRDHLLGLGFTQMSAGSCTEPGGYPAISAGVGERPAAAQFTVEDRRSAADIAAGLERLGFEPVWKDWDAGFAAAATGAEA